MSDHSILLKLYRDFNKDEAVMFLIKKIRALEYENGILKSERDEAIDTAKATRVSYDLRLKESVAAAWQQWVHQQGLPEDSQQPKKIISIEEKIAGQEKTIKTLQNKVAVFETKYPVLAK